MIRLFVQSLIIVGLACVVFTTGAAVWQRLSGGIVLTEKPLMATQDVADPPSSGGNVTVVNLPPLRTYRETLVRPLFFTGRRFPEPKAKPKPRVNPKRIVKKPAAKIAKTVLKLRGVFLDGDQQKALISIQNQRPDWVGLNQEIGGWTLTKIKPDQVHLRAGGRQKTLNLYKPHFPN